MIAAVPCLARDRGVFFLVPVITGDLLRAVGGWYFCCR
ncbi:MAG: hypothetical protein CM1200mP2_34930 [Planctomycetaceae bacterium]|nr:MAG: hypothetical protein CM1200mP2_34930 [Planctomycetaceae bacterium]